MRSPPASSRAGRASRLTKYQQAYADIARDAEASVRYGPVGDHRAWGRDAT